MGQTVMQALQAAAAAGLARIDAQGYVRRQVFGVHDDLVLGAVGRSPMAQAVACGEMKSARFGPSATSRCQSPQYQVWFAKKLGWMSSFFMSSNCSRRTTWLWMAMVRLPDRPFFQTPSISACIATAISLTDSPLAQRDIVTTPPSSRRSRKVRHASTV